MCALIKREYLLLCSWDTYIHMEAAYLSESASIQVHNYMIA